MDADPRYEAVSSVLPLVSFSREETILAALPFFSLDYGHQRRQYRISYETQLTGPDVDATLQWQVSADPVYGYPDAFDRKVFKLIEYLALEDGRPVQNPIRFSIRQVLQLLGLAPFASHFARVRSSIRRIAAVTVQSHLIYTTGRRQGKATQTFHVYDMVSFKDASKGEEIVTDEHWIALGAWYLHTMNHNPMPQLDLDFFRDIRAPVASRLYELLTVKFGHVIEQKIAGWQVAYPTLCRLLPIQQTLGSPQRQLDAAHQKLMATGFIDDATWEKHDKNWVILYVPGRRARLMYEQIPNQEKRLVHAHPSMAIHDQPVTLTSSLRRPLSPSAWPSSPTSDLSEGHESSDVGTLAHWGFREHPFDTTPNPKFYFEAPQFKEVLVTLDQAVSTQAGAMLLTGECGCGKTLITRTFVQSLNARAYDVALLTNPRWDSLELLREILYQFGHTVDVTDKAAVLRKIEAQWFSTYQAGRHTILIIDEAQLIKNQSTFEELRLLLNFQLDDRYLVTLILVGQPELHQQIHDMPQFEQRLAFQHHLTALSEMETEAYIRHRLALAGATRDIFTPDGIRQAYLLSDGVPRLINTLCTRVLLSGWINRENEIDGYSVEQAGISHEFQVPSSE
jgi:general secretion pathway protein A